MFQYEYEKRPPSSTSYDSRDTATTDWSRVCPSGRDSRDRHGGGRHSGGRDRRDRDSGRRDSRDRDSGIDRDCGDRDRKDRDSGRQDSERQDSGRQDNGRQNSGRQDSGRQDSRRQDSGRQDSGRQDSGRQDSGRQDSGRQESGRQDSRDRRGRDREERDSGVESTSHRSWSRGDKRHVEIRGDKSHGSHVDGDVNRSDLGPPSLARRPLPPRPTRVDRIPMQIPVSMPSKTTVPLKVWIVASASCFAVCAALVLATVIITKWGATDAFSTREVFSEMPEPIYGNPHPQTQTTTADSNPVSESEENEIQFPILEKLFFKNIVGNRDPKRNDRIDLSLSAKHQIHPLHESIHHADRKIEKKDQAKYAQISNSEIDENRAQTSNLAEIHENGIERNNGIEREFQIQAKFTPSLKVPDFKPKLPDVFVNRDMHIVGEYLARIRKPVDYEEYYNDENLYSDYMESNSMTSYLIEKVQELHDWITSDPDFEISTNVTITKNAKVNDGFGQLLKALNESLIEGNITIVMNKLKDIYFGENYTHTNHTRKVILSNSTDLLSFGILTLDIMLLHNIQLMAWENQEPARAKMLKDPDVFAFNALFLEPAKVEAKQNEINNHDTSAFMKRQNVRQEADDFDIGRNLLENVMEIGMSTARAAIHLGRAYKNTKNVINQLSNPNKEALNANIQSQMSRNVEGNTHALHHLQTSFKNDSAANTTFTELDCVWLLYCKNLAATAKLNPPYGTMARINGMALRMLAGELSPERALDTMVYEALAGWTDLRCADMFPRCSQVDAASVVLGSIIAPVRKSQPSTVPRSR